MIFNVINLNNRFLTVIILQSRMSVNIGNISLKSTCLTKSVLRYIKSWNNLYLYNLLSSSEVFFNKVTSRYFTQTRSSASLICISNAYKTNWIFIQKYISFVNIVSRVEERQTYVILKIQSTNTLWYISSFNSSQKVDLCTDAHQSILTFNTNFNTKYSYTGTGV